jgi:hypothetical protein
MKILTASWLVFAVSACVGDGTVDPPAGEGEGEGEGPRFPLCATPADVVACDPIFDDTRCPAGPPTEADQPCDEGLVCTYCGFDNNGTITVQMLPRASLGHRSVVQ